MTLTKYQKGGQIIIFVALLLLVIGILIESHIIGIMSVGTAFCGIPWVLICDKKGWVNKK